MSLILLFKVTFSWLFCDSHGLQWGGDVIPKGGCLVEIFSSCYSHCKIILLSQIWQKAFTTYWNLQPQNHAQILILIISKQEKKCTFSQTRKMQRQSPFFLFTPSPPLKSLKDIGSCVYYKYILKVWLCFLPQQLSSQNAYPTFISSFVLLLAMTKAIIALAARGFCHFNAIMLLCMATYH